MQLRLPWNVGPRPQPARHFVVGGHQLPVAIVRHRRARRYVVRVTPDEVRVTVPRGASIAGALAFALRQADWVEREWRRQRERSAPWDPGTSLWFRGERVVLSLVDGHVTLGSHSIEATAAAQDVRSTVEAWLRSKALGELSDRCLALAKECRLEVARVVVRNQRSRWGACSPKRVISLNWRLIQMPSRVIDYVIIHELMHLRQPNHSRAFWREVDSVCAWWREAERWLRQHGREIL